MDLRTLSTRLPEPPPGIRSMDGSAYSSGHSPIHVVSPARGLLTGEHFAVSPAIGFEPADALVLRGVKLAKEMDLIDEARMLSRPFQDSTLRRQLTELDDLVQSSEFHNNTKGVPTPLRLIASHPYHVSSTPSNSAVYGTHFSASASRGFEPAIPRPHDGQARADFPGSASTDVSTPLRPSGTISFMDDLAGEERSLRRLRERIAVVLSTILPSSPDASQVQGLSSWSTLKPGEATASIQSPHTEVDMTVSALTSLASSRAGTGLRPGLVSGQPNPHPSALLVSGPPATVARLNRTLEPLTSECQRLLGLLLRGADFLMLLPSAESGVRDGAGVGSGAGGMSGTSSSAWQGRQESRRRVRVSLQTDLRTVSWSTTGRILEGTFSVQSISSIRVADGYGHDEPGTRVVITCCDSDESTLNLQLLGPDGATVADWVAALTLLHDILPA